MAHRQQTPEDPYARDSFSFRGMKKWQLWAITIVAVAVVIAVILYAGI